MEAIDREICAKKKKVALLQHSLDTEGRKVLKHMPVVIVCDDNNDEVDEFAFYQNVGYQNQEKRNVIMILKNGGRGRATKKDGRLERELRVAANTEGGGAAEMAREHTMHGDTCSDNCCASERSLETP
ncbi:hypothetical protein NDU88_001110 [Pleurodeles waltl]|uniref:Uncharacterized protein n=1 Tax=Pleurodeles waltl TaxID=8319 RepID=A0AAV7NDU3_PLEWA|nr:hypothetical protein NDU88_001110 [Pleurodeles waltl]